MALAVVTFTFTSCEEDQETIGSEVIGEPGFQAELYEDAEIDVRNVNLEAVQTNNLSLPNNQRLHLLGVNEHNFFGQQKAHLLTQLSLSSASPTFGEEARLDSVVLSVPYFHTEEVSEEGVTTYELDSIYGDGALKLEVYESNFYLNSYDPESGFQSAQRYYSDMKDQVENNLGELLYTDENFRPSSAEVVNFVGDGSGSIDTVQLPPQLRIHLPVTYFKEKIIDQEGSVNLSNSNNFNTYFRGLYIRTDAQGSDGLMMHLNLLNEQAGVTMYYSNEQESEEEGEESQYIANSYKFNFNASQVNLLEQQAPAEIPGSLFLRGGQGSMAVVELFTGTDSDDDGVSDELADLRANEWLINEANLVFKVNRDAMQGSDEPERVYLYNLDQGQLLADYSFDNPETPQNPLGSVANQGHLVPLERDEDGKGIEYKIRITRHVHNILNQGADNVRLGLAVTHNVNIINNSAAKSGEGDDEVERIPVGSVVSPEGTVLYGIDAANPEDRPKLKIYYTKPNN